MLTHLIYRALPSVAGACLLARPFLVRKTTQVTPPKPRLPEAAVRRVGIAKRGSPHTLRHSFATHLLEDGHEPSPCRNYSGTGT